eukprot:TRINITY_DN7615_c0_g1_i1.p1 TRINITY_DN7615_c0_g1~~TRINITY_DN7615_c0_g1_i1.p1  ORF type:complete len:160 (-),score=23.49 TRINITY_DN7615_c0_g1_i1:17-496(-)
MATKNFTSGIWIGFYTLNGKRREMTVNFNFGYNGSINGSGSDDYGNFTVKGEYSPTPPYNASFSREGEVGQMEFVGFRESSTGGIFGNWKGSSGTGDFHVKPGKDTDAAVKRIKEAARKTKMDQLQGMGFPNFLCEQALDSCDDDITRCIEWITSHLEK